MAKRPQRNQSFLPFYLEDGGETIAGGNSTPCEALETWGGGEDRYARRNLGQVATPREVARIMARWVSAGRPDTILDPAVGTGNLLQECRTLSPAARLIGVERDEATIAHAGRSAPAGTRLMLGDYMKCRLDPVPGIVANPPYVKAHHLCYTENDWRFFESMLGASLDRLSNLYALFLLKIWHDLLPNGRAAVIVPAEFLNANFGEPIKKWVLQTMRPVGLAVFDPSFSVFGNALTTSCIFLVRKDAHNGPVLICRALGLEDAERFQDDLCTSALASRETNKYLDASEWNPSEKWLNKILGLWRDNLAGMPRKIGDYFRCLRGIATGANHFFVLPMSEIKRRGLELRDFSPCIARSSEAEGPVFEDTHFDGLNESGKRCFLLDPAGAPDPVLRSYLDEGEKAGIPERHLPGHRPVWYAPENRAPADVWVGVFSRERVKCILNAARIKNLTCFHGLYSKHSAPGRPELVTLFLNSSLGRTAFHQVNRFYGDGLYKLEPKDVEVIPCPELPTMTEQEARLLREEMVRLGELSPQERSAAADKLTARFFRSGGKELPQCGSVERHAAP